MTIGFYVVHAQGRSHIESGKPCQDAYAICDCGFGVTVAAIADGLGSCMDSQKSSRKAVDSICAFIKNEIPAEPSPEVLSAIMVAGMNHAYKDVLEMLTECGIELRDAQTTLSAIILYGEGAVYGHSGDGVVIGLEADGRYSVICEPIKGDRPNSTYPFTKGWRHWHVGTVDRRLGSVLLATDGVGDVIYPPFLRPDHEVIAKQAAFFMHPFSLGLKEGEALDEGLSNELSESTLLAIQDSRNVTWSTLTDDVTAVILVDSEIYPPVIESNQTFECLRKKYEEFYDISDQANSTTIENVQSTPEPKKSSDNFQKDSSPTSGTIVPKTGFWKRTRDIIRVSTKKSGESLHSSNTEKESTSPGGKSDDA